MISIEQITPQLTWRLRREVLYPGKEIAEMEMDVDLGGYHFGTFSDNKLVGVISLFQNGPDFQFRKFAVDVSWQRGGIGTAMLAYIEDFAKTNNGKNIWCNARTNATIFYRKSGYSAKGGSFRKNNIDYVVMEKRL